jgi:pilus assembly protein Flp/PilA
MEIHMTKFASFLNDESGASAAEYVLILAVSGSASVVGAALLGSSISNALSKASTYIDAKANTFS